MRVPMIMSAVALALVFGAAGATFAQTPTGANAKFEACRSQAVAAGLSGTQRKQAVDACLARSDMQTAMLGEPSYAACRAGAISRGLSGEALGRFVNVCMNG